MTVFASVCQRPALGASQKSSRNDYMKSGLYSTFTIQSLQVSPSSQPVKTELLLQQDPSPKGARMPKEVRTGGWRAHADARSLPPPAV